MMYRVYDDYRNQRRVDLIDDDGMVTPLEPTAEDKKLEPGYYDDKFELIEGEDE